LEIAVDRFAAPASVVAEPVGTPSIKVMDQNPVGMATPDGQFIDTDSSRRFDRIGLHLSVHVELVQLLDRIPADVRLFCHGLDGLLAALPTDPLGVTLGVAVDVGQELQPFGLHGTTPWAANATHGDAQVDPPRSAIEIPDQTFALVIPPSTAFAAGAAKAGFFPAVGAEASTNSPRRESSSDELEGKIRGTGRHPGYVDVQAPKWVDQAWQEFASCPPRRNLHAIRAIRDSSTT
jgi:hypothetical protein